MERVPVHHLYTFSIDMDVLDCKLSVNRDFNAFVVSMFVTCACCSLFTKKRSNWASTSYLKLGFNWLLAIHQRLIDYD